MVRRSTDDTTSWRRVRPGGRFNPGAPCSELRCAGVHRKHDAGTSESLGVIGGPIPRAVDCTLRRALGCKESGCRHVPRPWGLDRRVVGSRPKSVVWPKALVQRALQTMHPSGGLSTKRVWRHDHETERLGGRAKADAGVNRIGNARFDVGSQYDTVVRRSAQRADQRCG